MDRDNVTSLAAHKLADLMIQEWISAYSDNGAIWDRDYEALQVLKQEATDEDVAEAYRLAKARWKKMFNHD
jgi:hypothetical protein